MKKWFKKKQEMCKLNNIFEGSANFGEIWFKICGYGISIRNINKSYRLSFSERNGIVRIIKLGQYVIKPLKPKSK